jgi:post-segregation antitoxin (ccd killing protein)
MTTEESAGSSAARHQPRSAEDAAEPGDSPEARAQEMTISAADTAASAPPDDPQQLAEEIKRTREQLGETVEALVAKADVKARAQDKASQLTGRLKGKAGQAKQQAAVQAGRVQRQLADKTTGPRQKVVSLTGPARDQARQQAAAAAANISKATPEPVQRAAAKAAATAWQRRAPLAMAIGAVVLAWLVIARWRRR